VATIQIVYGTREGHTDVIVERMREAIAARGHEVVAEHAGRSTTISAHAAGVIVGSPVHAGKHEQGVVEFVQKHRERLEAMPSAFFQVCLTAADDRPEARALVDGLLTEFRERTGWHPASAETFAGALAWTRYGPVKRLLMKAVLRSQPLSADERDTSHDTDYTDYEAVRRFAEGFAAALPAAPRPPAT
jgi:menaquinone-dependent protoporphyrinogen oxidase